MKMEMKFGSTLKASPPKRKKALVKKRNPLRKREKKLSQR
jgi:hypothetical protein